MKRLKDRTDTFGTFGADTFGDTFGLEIVGHVPDVAGVRKCGATALECWDGVSAFAQEQPMWTKSGRAGAASWLHACSGLANATLPPSPDGYGRTSRTSSTPNHKLQTPPNPFLYLNQPPRKLSVYFCCAYGACSWVGGVDKSVLIPWIEGGNSVLNIW